MTYDLKDLSEQMPDTFKRLDKAMCNIIKRLRGLKGLSEQIPETFKQLDTVMRNLNKRLDEAMRNIIKRLIGKINYYLEERLIGKINYVVERKTRNIYLIKNEYIKRFVDKSYFV